MDKIKGKKVALVYHDLRSARSLEERAKMHGFELQAAACDRARCRAKGHLAASVPEPSRLRAAVGRDATPPRSRKPRPLATRATRCTACGGPVLNPMCATWAQAPRLQRPGTQWFGQGPEGHPGNHETRARQGPGHGAEDEVGSVLARSMIQMLGVEAVRRAQERFGKGKVMTGEQVRWGFGNQPRPEEDRRAGLWQRHGPVFGCADHMGGLARMQTWDGAKWKRRCRLVPGRRASPSSPWSRRVPSTWLTRR